MGMANPRGGWLVDFQWKLQQMKLSELREALENETGSAEISMIANEAIGRLEAAMKITKDVTDALQGEN